MKRLLVLALAVLTVLVSCGTEKGPAKPELVLTVSREVIEVNQGVALSCSVHTPEGELPAFQWQADGGTISTTAVAGEIDWLAPDTPGVYTLSVKVHLDSGEQTLSKKVEVLTRDALKRTAEIIFEVDTSTLKNVWVNADHPSESFTPPLFIKGTFRYDPETEEAFAGGSWPCYDMRDDGKNGDRVADDGIWSIRLNFEKTDAKVYFAFDDNSFYRVEFESGVTWRMKIAWIELDEYPDDNFNPAFVPDGDKIIRWTREMAAEGKLWGEEAGLDDIQVMEDE
jgi:hypothetical protein